MITISKAKIGDAQKIRAFEQKEWNEKDIVGPYEAATFIRYGYAFVAKDKGEIVGVIIAMKTKNNEVKVIDWIVAEDYRRQRIGTRLYAALEKEVKGYPLLSFVECNNEESANGHQNLGFEKVKKIKDAFGMGKNEQWWLMRKENRK